MNVKILGTSGSAHSNGWMIIEGAPTISQLASSVLGIDVYGSGKSVASRDPNADKIPIPKINIPHNFAFGH